MNISVLGVSKTYGTKETQVQALKPCDFTINSGEQIAVTGTSGSGKSTLLRLIGGLDRPQREKYCTMGRKSPHTTRINCLNFDCAISVLYFKEYTTAV